MSERPLAALILAAGLGTRLKSARPKALHPLAGRPMVAYLSETVAALAPDRTVIVAGAGMDEIAALVPGAVPVVQDPPLGTADAVKAAGNALEGFAGDIVILYADTPLVSPATLTRLLEAHAGAPLTVLAMRPDDPAAYGRIISGPEGDLEAIVEADDATPAEGGIGLCNSGIMAVDADALADLVAAVKKDNARGEYYLTDIVGLARQREFRCAVVEGPVEELMGINSRRDLAVAEALVQERLRDRAMEGGATLVDPTTVILAFDTRLGRDVVIEPNVVFGPGVAVGDNVTIRAFSHIEGARIAEGAVVGPFARLRPEADIGAKARIGNFVEVKKSVIGKAARVNHLTYIGDARIGPDANIGAGTITCNYDGVKKSETDIGAGAFIGSNSCLVAPVKIGAGAVVGAGSVISRDVKAGALGLTRAEQKDVPGWAARRNANTPAAKPANNSATPRKTKAPRRAKKAKRPARARTASA